VDPSFIIIKVDSIVGDVRGCKYADCPFIRPCNMALWGLSLKVKERAVPELSEPAIEKCFMIWA
jgi:hypothetical protein